MLLQDTILEMLDIIEVKNGLIKGRVNLVGIISQIPNMPFETKILWDTAKLIAAMYQETITKSNHNDLDSHLDAITDELIMLAKKLHPGVIPPVSIETFTGTILLSFILHLHTKHQHMIIFGKKRVTS
ncbi:MAG: hypothetical protein Q8P20_01400 [bacterium]|nr:hypothetical protein [bacterium]